jgi:predicted lipoprotein with Yx(FWY)xxD motif
MNTTRRTTPRRTTWRSSRAIRVSALMSAVALIAAGAAFAASTTTIRTSNNQTLGRILVGPARYTLYVWCKGVSDTNCPGKGSPAWPALVATGKVVAASGSGLKSSKLSTRKLSNGKHQVTYYGHPLYLYRGDKKAGQANGEGQYSGNGAWFAINTSGRAVPPGIY